MISCAGRTTWPTSCFSITAPSDVRNWSDYNGRVRDWIARLLGLPGALWFMACRTADGSSPNTIMMLQFRTVEEARSAAASNGAKAILEELRAVGAYAAPLVVEGSPFTPEPLRPP